jgi:hypothetical protein
MILVDTLDGREGKSFTIVPASATRLDVTAAATSGRRWDTCEERNEIQH